jgi:aspartyl-tRNA(Asn)/glutamyl-tRNA(Gln) amidotransferase subunit A
MNENANLYELTASQASKLIRNREISPVALVHSLLDHIHRLEPSLKVWVTLDDKSAIDAAKISERRIMNGSPIGILEGIPIGIKDIYYTKGLRTTACATQYEHFKPSYDATSVKRLKAEGGIILGKAMTTQFAATDPSPTVNPWHPDHTPGGSSSGSAVAVASRMCPVALGSQTVGSTLRPAAYNGIIGFKPTYGRISRHGIVALAWSLDTVGILVRSVDDAALMLRAMAGYDPADKSSSKSPIDEYTEFNKYDQHPPRIGVVRDFFYQHVQDEIQRHTEHTIKRLQETGATIKEVKLPDSFQIHEAARNVVFHVEAATFHQEMFAKNPESYGPLLRRVIETGSLIPGIHYVQAQRIRRQFRTDMETLLSEVDVLLTPATTSAAPRDRTTTGNPLFQGSWTSCGLPTLSIPSGVDNLGMPLGIQLVGSPFAETTLLRASKWCEATLGVTLRPPGLD